MLTTIDYMLDTCSKVVDKALRHGADESEAYMVDKEVLTIRLARSSVVEAKAARDKGLALRIIKDKSISGSSTSLLDDEHIDRVLDNALSNAMFMQMREEWVSLPHPSKVSSIDNCYDKAIEDMSVDDLARYAEVILNECEGVVVSGVVHVVKEHVCIANSNGVNVIDKGTYIIGNVTADLESGEHSSKSGFGFSAGRMLRSFNPESIAREARDMAIRARDASRVDGVYSIVFEPYALGELLSFVLAYNFNAKAYQDRRSCFHGRIGDRIAVDSFSLLDEPRRGDALGSKPFDDEGIATYNKNIVDKGVFKGLVYDSFYAYKDRVTSTGNAIRVGYPVGRGVNPLPYPSFHNIVVANGDYNMDEMIRDTKHGLIVGRLWYTYPVNPEQGDFSCTARSGIFEVRDGEIVGARRMVRIVDNVKRVLNSISAIGKESKQILQWHAIPCITPNIRVEGVKVIPL